MNKVSLEGIITKVSEVQNKGNFTMREINMRIDREYNGKTYSDLVPLTLFGDMAVNFSIPEGSKISVEGRIKGREYIDKNGINRVFISIGVKSIINVHQSSLVASEKEEAIVIHKPL